MGTGDLVARAWPESRRIEDLELDRGADRRGRCGVVLQLLDVDVGAGDMVTRVWP